MAKFLFDGVETNFITIYPIVIIVIMIGVIFEVIAGIGEYQMVGNRIMRTVRIFKVHYEMIYCFIATIFSVAFFCALAYVSRDEFYRFLVNCGETKSAAALGSAFYIFLYSIVVFAVIVYTGIITGVIRRATLKRLLRATTKLHH